MSEAPRRGEVWLAELDKRRPVVVLTRDPMGRYLDSVIVAPVTSTVRGVSTEVELGPEDGIRHPSVANLDNLQLLSKRQLVRPLGNVRPATVRALCRALGRATACASTHAHAIAAMLPARSGRRWHQGVGRAERRCSCTRSGPTELATSRSTEPLTSLARCWKLIALSRGSVRTGGITRMRRGNAHLAIS